MRVPVRGCQRPRVHQPSGTEEDASQPFSWRRGARASTGAARRRHGACFARILARYPSLDAGRCTLGGWDGWHPRARVH
ncbi:hypothetical protein A176_006297 [Myxococcus hansupus]|uniref:Uncharacterized protein n=1 Tax=Pseudomyxococcus hansupus TaxID=1297742 RepID=A0A0H4X705_9BACT|nr:hypothetical protein A176_006297 [Myxococcus hansupus]